MRPAFSPAVSSSRAEALQQRQSSGAEGRAFESRIGLIG